MTTEEALERLLSKNDALADYYADRISARIAENIADKVVRKVKGLRVSIEVDQ